MRDCRILMAHDCTITYEYDYEYVFSTRRTKVFCPPSEKNTSTSRKISLQVEVV